MGTWGHGDGNRASERDIQKEFKGFRKKHRGDREQEFTEGGEERERGRE